MSTATTVEPTRSTHRVTYRRMTLDGIIRLREAGAIVDVRQFKYDHYARVVKVEDTSRRGVYYNITTMAFDVEDTIEWFGHNSRLHARVWTPKPADQMSKLRPLPPVAERVGDDVAKIVQVGDVITVRPFDGMAYKLRVTETPECIRKLESKLDPARSYIAPWGQVLNMKGRARYFRRTGTDPRPKTVWVNEIESIEVGQP